MKCKCGKDAIFTCHGAGNEIVGYVCDTCPTLSGTIYATMEDDYIPLSRLRHILCEGCREKLESHEKVYNNPCDYGLDLVKRPDKHRGRNKKRNNGNGRKD